MTKNNELTLRKKIASMLMFGFRGAGVEDQGVLEIVDDIGKLGLGGVLLFGYNINFPEQLKNLTNLLLQADSKLLIAVDQEGGSVQRLSSKNGFKNFDTAKKIAASANLSNDSAILDEKKIPEYLLKVLSREFEPFSSLRILSQHNLYDNFKNDCRVIFDGSGGDEIGAGYSYYLAPWYLDNIKKFDKKKIKQRFFKNVNYIKNNTLSVSDFIKGSFAQFKKPGSSTIDGSIYQNESIYSREFHTFNNKLKIEKPFKSHLRNAQYADLFYLKLPRSLKYADRSSMYNSIETRVPFLDHKVVEWSLQIPSKFKLLQNQQRIIMKYPFRNYVNKEVLYLNKRTIADPQSEWLKTHLKTLFYETVNSKNFNDHGFFNKKNIINYYERFTKSSKHFNTFLLFQILVSELWSQNILSK